MTNEYDVVCFKSSLINKQKDYHVCLYRVYSTDKEDYVVKIIKLNTFLKLEDINIIPYEYCDWYLERQLIVDIKQTRLLKINKLLGK